MRVTHYDVFCGLAVRGRERQNKGREEGQERSREADCIVGNFEPSVTW